MAVISAIALVAFVPSLLYVTVGASMGVQMRVQRRPTDWETAEEWASWSKGRWYFGAAWLAIVMVEPSRLFIVAMVVTFGVGQWLRGRYCKYQLVTERLDKIRAVNTAVASPSTSAG